MNERDTQPANARAQGVTEEELFQQLRSRFIEGGGDDLSPEEERCLRRIAGDIKGNVYTRSQVERAMARGWRPCDDLLSQGS